MKKNKKNSLSRLKKNMKKYEKIPEALQTIRHLPVEHLSYEADIDKVHSNITSNFEITSRGVREEIAKLGMKVTDLEIEEFTKSSIVSGKFSMVNAAFVDTVYRMRKYSSNSRNLSEEVIPLARPNTGIRVSIVRNFLDQSNLNNPKQILFEYNIEAIALAYSIGEIISNITTDPLSSDHKLKDMSESSFIRPHNQKYLNSFLLLIRENINKIPAELHSIQPRPRDQIFAKFITSSILDFIIGHELAHLLHGDFPSMAVPESSRFFIESKEVIRNFHKIALNDSIEQEYMADLRSLDFMIRTANNLNNRFLPLGIAIFIGLSRLINKNGDTKSLEIESTTHPTIANRLKVMKLYILKLIITGQIDKNTMVMWEISDAFYEKFMTDLLVRIKK